ncbi:C-type lectin domain family 4 member M-like isoform X2 [Tachysurus vachellii]|uniref:C-type lectin domain family 4 member M-like isoform X2 n=1 Tax=Tachysurus vachellii TaxID=175792 RepID=UPI00296AA3B4|nr:C-type lectin domain family 4 member M-like isoform X2 [Tachysurus vachellii]
MYIQFCNFGPYVDVKVPADSKDELTTDIYRRVRLYKRISAVFIVFSLFLVVVVLSLAVELNVKCPESAEPNCELCQTMCPPLKGIRECQRSECEEDWEMFENSCYFFSDERLKWQESREACQKLGGDLVVIDNERVQKFLTENWRMLYWIGLRYSEKKQWMWINNTAPTQSYWIQGQPNPDTQGSCALLSGGTSDLNNWLSNHCEVYSHFICQSG